MYQKEEKVEVNQGEWWREAYTKEKDEDELNGEKDRLKYSMEKYKGRFTIKKNEDEYTREKDEWKYYTSEKDKTSIPGEG